MTELPAYNQLLEDAERFLQGNLTPEELEGTLRAAEETLDDLYTQFFLSLPFQEDHPVLEEALDPIFCAFGRLAAQREPLREALAEGEAETARALLEEGSQALQALHAEFARLREALGERQPVSRVPAVDELARVTDAFARGTLPEETLAQRLAQFADYHQALGETLATLEPSDEERDLYDPDELREGLAQQGHGLGLMEEALAQRDGAMLQEGLEELLLGTGRLVYLQQRLEGAAEQRERLCLRCSAPNPPTARYCSACMAQMPDPGLARGSTFVTSDEPGEGAALPDHLLLLSQHADMVRAGRGDREEFRRTLQWLRDNVSKSRQLLGQMEAPPADTPAEQLEALARAQEAMRAGMEDFEQGLALMETFLERPDPGRLDHGLEMARRGACEMLEIEAIFAELRRG